MVTARFKFVGGKLCLDFVNTATFRTDVPLRDKLARYQDLDEWSAAAGLPKRGRNPGTRKIFVRAIALREALYRLFKSVIDRQKPAQPDLAILQRELDAAWKHQQLEYSKHAYSWSWDQADAPDRMLWPVALSAADLLTSRDRENIRQCGGHECGWLFLDTSRNRKRQWCVMKICGNRAKAQRFRRKASGSGQERRILRSDREKS